MLYLWSEMESRCLLSNSNIYSLTFLPWSELTFMVNKPKFKAAEERKRTGSCVAVICLHDKSICCSCPLARRTQALCLASVMVLSNWMWGRGFLIDGLPPLSGCPQFVKQTTQKKTIFLSEQKRRPQRRRCLPWRIDHFWEALESLAPDHRRPCLEPRGMLWPVVVPLVRRWRCQVDCDPELLAFPWSPP